MASNIHPPSDSRQMADSVRVLERTIQRARKISQAIRTVVKETGTQLTRKARDLARNIGENAKKKAEAAQETGRQLYRALIEQTAEIVSQAHQVLPHLKQMSGKYAQWLTNFIPTAHNVDTLANQAGRLRWKIENEGFNIQKNGGFNLEHPYSQNDTARKVFYYLLQIAYLLFQLMEKGSLFRKAFPQGLGSLKNIAFRLLEAWRNLRLSPQAFYALYSGRCQIRFDTS